MKKTARKLVLHRETVRNLESLRGVDGAVQPAPTVTCFDCTANGACISGTPTCFTCTTCTGQG
jgi:hypothetical protein